MGQRGVCGKTLALAWRDQRAASDIHRKEQELMEMTRLRKDLFANLDTLRYGGDSLPQGDVWKADRLLSGEGATLTVTTEQLKTFYLRGYIGGRYEGGRWLALKKAAYAGSNEGMLKWLEMENFPVGAAVSRSAEAGSGYPAAGESDRSGQSRRKSEIFLLSLFSGSRHYNRFSPQLAGYGLSC